MLDKLFALFNELGEDKHAPAWHLGVVQKSLYYVGELTREARASIFVTYAFVGVSLPCTIDLEAVNAYRLYVVVVRLSKEACLQKLIYLCRV